MTEFKFQAIIVPENYDYSEEEIVYRIFFDEQLISERSLPVLKPNQAIVDSFNIKINESNQKKLLVFYNKNTKKSYIKKIIINDFSCEKKVSLITLKGLSLKIGHS